MAQSERIARLKEQVAALPTTPGVYRFYNSSGEVIYVGKAKNLRRRVSSYFVERADHSAKVRVMVSRIERLEHIDTATEQDALLLENSLIKRLQPRYNILLKDDKTYPWIVVRNEHFPRVESTRRVVRDGSTYFGPYASVTMQRSMLEYAHSLFHIRTCRLDLSPEAVRRGKYKVCLQYHIGNCLGPCEGHQTEEEYAAELEVLRRHLRGDVRATRAYLEEQMQAAAAALKFEVAALYKSRLAILENYVSKSVIVSAVLGNVDVFSLIVDDDEAYCNFVRVEEGTVTGSFTSRLTVGAESDRAKILAEAISLISERIEGPLAREIIVPYLPEEGLFEGVRFTVPKRGEKLALLEFSERSARLFRAERLKNMEIKNPERHTDRLMAAMMRELHLDREPRHIECFDNSNNQGTYPVASCVVFRDGKPSRKEYRHFNIKTVVGPDDFASMREIVRRRYSRLMEEGKELPDLIIVDGGKGQLSSAYSVLQELGIEGQVPIVGLAKRIEEIFFPNDPEPYYLDRTGEPLKVVMHLRNEAHRFGITFHRNKRSA
ncbi:MAG: excinuclease ABC subunit C, partial [Tidjanibacter sp.]|nr:excinuclease ABC subunit C [Tidjanibacter sp.]